jgi:hypothetical protein
MLKLLSRLTQPTESAPKPPTRDELLLLFLLKSGGETGVCGLDIPRAIGVCR